MSLPPNYNLFKRFPNFYYIETGCWLGDSMQLAMDSKSFQVFHGVESDHGMFEATNKRFRDWPMVKIWEGESNPTLIRVLAGIHQPATIFLDAHSSLIDGEPDCKQPFPLLDELLIIAEHVVSGHVLIIDDILHLTHPDVTGWTKEDIEEAVLRINPKYNIEYISNPVKKNMIIAHL